jgi:small-conductance mechanosensitive channel
VKLRHKLAFVALGALLLAAVVGYFATDDTDTQTAAKTDAQPATVVDRRPLQIAQRLLPLATTAEEKDLAREAVRVGDHSVDLAFTIALLQAAEHPADSTPEIRKFRARLEDAARVVAEDSARLAQLTSRRGSQVSGSAETQIELTKAQLDLHRGDLEDARDDLLRAGGDPQGRIQQMVADHDSADHAGAAARPVASDSTAQRASPNRSLLDEIDRWRTVRRKQRILGRAQEETTGGIATLTMQRQTFAQHVAQVQAAPATDPLAKTRHLSNDQKVLASMTRRVEDQVTLLDVYSRWSSLVATQRRSVLHAMFLDLAWLLLILLCAVGLSAWLERVFIRLAPERRRLHTLQTVTKFGVRGLATIGVALVLVGPPTQLATILGLAGAGLTVALKDFIVGFFGWFALMGKNGIRLGDWVEINGVSGEVVEITPFHTVLLETGNWTDAGHPTGRRVTFSNGFAIDGHYFNFSTSGQWLWDEVELVVPMADAPGIIDAIRKIVTEETSETAHLAEQEWGRASAARSVSGFSAAPAIDVRPGANGMHVVIRYVTRAQNRHQLRTRLYQAAAELLARPKDPAPAATSRSSA